MAIVMMIVDVVDVVIFGNGLGTVSSAMKSVWGDVGGRFRAGGWSWDRVGR